MQSALLPVEPACKLLAKAGSYLSASQYCLEHTSLQLPTSPYRLYSQTRIHLLTSSPHLSPSTHSKPCTSLVEFVRTVAHPPSLSQITAHPLNVQNITRFGCKSTWTLPIWPTHHFSHSPSPSLPMKSLITPTCKEDDSGRCGGPSGQTHHGLPWEANKVWSEVNPQAGNSPLDTAPDASQQPLTRNLFRELAVRTWLADTDYL